MFGNVKNSFKLIVSCICAMSILLMPFTVNQSTDAVELTVTYSHSNLFNESDKLTSVSAKRDGTYYTYEHGRNGSFLPMTDFVVNPWFEAWSTNEQHPMICSWFIGGGENEDGALIWHGNASGHISISSTLPVCTDAAGKTAKLMILSRRNGKYCPIYPQKGEFEWKTVTSVQMQLDGVQADVKAGDEIVFLVQCNNDIINIDPKIDFTPDKNVECDDVDFSFWKNSTASFAHSGIFNSNGSTSSSAIDINGFGFSYCGINEKGIFALNDYVTNEWFSAWSDNGDFPMVSSWFIGGSADTDGAIVWHSKADGIATLTSQLDINNDSEDKKAELIIAVKRGNGYCPVYPVFGAFEWKEVTKQSEKLPETSVNIANGDEIVIAVRSSGNVVTVDPKIDFKFTSSEKISDDKFIVWEMGEKPPILYSHSGSFNDSDKEYPKAICDENSYFTYEFGKDGVFEPMVRYSKNKYYESWSAYGEDPMVSSWFISSAENVEGAIVFHTDKKGVVTLNSSLPLHSESGKQPALFMIVQRRNGNIYPLYPQKGKFKWQTVSDKNIDISEVSTVVSSGDTIEFVVKSENCVLNIDPQISLIESEKAVELSDSLFFKWQKSPENKRQDDIPLSPYTGNKEYYLVISLAVIMSAVILLWIIVMKRIMVV